jgi:hypothetical protein
VKALILPAKGIGDALLMMIASHALLKQGYSVTTCHPALIELQEWFPEHQFASEFSLALLENQDLVLIENDNGRRVKDLKELRDAGKLDTLGVFYPTYFPVKNGPLQKYDRVFDKTRPMAENIREAIANLLNSKPSLDNGLVIPKDLVHRRYKKRVLVHPMSSTPKKNWLQAKYRSLARSLEKEGYDPVFILTEKEQNEWKGVLNKEQFPLFKTLDTLARYTYESGYLIGNDSLLGHLASNLQIPTLIVAREPEQMRLWRPGWLKGEVVTAPTFALKKYWPYFLSKRKVLSAFNKLSCSD